MSPPVLVPPQKHKLFKLYLSADERAIGSALIQEFEGKEHVIYYVSRRLLMLKQGILLSKGCVFACISLALCLDIIYYRLSVLW